MRLFGKWIGKESRRIRNIINNYGWTPIYSNHVGRYNCLIYLSQIDGVKGKVYYLLAGSYIKYTWNHDYDIKLLDESFKKVMDLNLLSIPEDLKDLVDDLGYLKEKYVKYLNRSK